MDSRHHRDRRRRRQCEHLRLRPGFSPSLASLTFAALVTAAGLALAPSAAADDVHLTNGNTFEGVIARVEGDHVRILLDHGEIRLPMSRVLEIDQGEAPLETYLARRQALFTEQAQMGPEELSEAAGGWLELARWARRHDLGHGVRESALRAARLNPDLPGLEEVLGDLGYVRDEDSGRWMTYERYMEQRGFVRYGNAWVEREELERRLAEARKEAERRRARRAEQAAELALQQAIEARIQAEVAKEVAARQPLHPGLAYGAPVVGTIVPFFVPVVSHGGHHGRHGHPHGPRPPRVGHPTGDQIPPRHVRNTVRNVFDPPASERLQQRDLGGLLGTNLPPGWAGAPGRLHHDP